LKSVVVAALVADAQAGSNLQHIGNYQRRQKVESLSRTPSQCIVSKSHLLQTNRILPT
jgi:hypothetical protein